MKCCNEHCGKEAVDFIKIEAPGDYSLLIPLCDEHVEVYRGLFSPFDRNAIAMLTERFNTEQFNRRVYGNSTTQ